MAARVVSDNSIGDISPCSFSTLAIVLRMGPLGRDQPRVFGHYRKRRAPEGMLRGLARIAVWLTPV